MMATIYLFLKKRGYEGNIRMKAGDAPLMGSALFYLKSDFELDGGDRGKIRSNIFSGINSEGNPMS